MTKLWKASKKQILNSNLFKFESFLSSKFKINFNQNYTKLLNWSIKNYPDFWDSIWTFCKVRGVKSKNKLIKSKIFYKNNFLPNSKLNFAENILSKSINFIQCL